MTRLAALAALALLLPLAAHAVECPAGAVLTGPAGVVDGDTIVFILGPPEIERYRPETSMLQIRLQGLAAPEDSDWHRDPGGPEATAAMVALVAGKAVSCTLDGDRNRERCVGLCEVNGRDVGETMVRAGVARDCPRFSGARYRDAEQAAADDGAGIRAAYALPGYCGPKENR